METLLTIISLATIGWIVIGQLNSDGTSPFRSRR